MPRWLTSEGVEIKRRCRDSNTESSWRRALRAARAGPAPSHQRARPPTGRLLYAVGTLDAESFGIPAILSLQLGEDSRGTECLALA